jgi:diguanylate cyclase (GGDEF)-like protein
MFRSFHDLSLRLKLTLVLTLTSVLVLLLAFMAFFLFERVSSETALVHDLTSLAEVVGANSTAALSFEDSRAADEILGTLRVRRSVVKACLYTSTGRLFAAYHRPDAADDPAPQMPGFDGVRVEGGHVRLFQGIFHNGERVGTVYLKADLSELQSRLRRYALAVLALMGVGAVAALLLAMRFQAVITRPILALHDAAQTVSQGRVFTVRVTSSGKDEIGGLTEAFNEMLAHIQARDSALQDAQRQLEQRVQQLLQEVADRKQAQAALRDSEEQLRHQAFHDALTGLPNRALMNDRLAVALAHAHRNLSRLAVMFLDIDRFKLINDSLGHTTGDELLRLVSVRLSKALREGDTLARLGGDEFILLLPGLGEDAAAAKVARKVLTALRQPFHLDGRELFVSASIGISLYPLDGSDAETLVKNADVAMYRAKEQGRDNYQLYRAELHVRALKRMTLESQLRAAVGRDEFRLYYQPIVDLASGTIVAAEALVRWQHPERGLVLPAEFVSVAEDTGLILPIGAWVLKTACVEAQSWVRRGLPPVRISINLSARQFQQDDFVRQISTILAETGLDPSRLELEITESVAMDNADHTVSVLRRMQDLGVRLTIDDFGTGYSSLSYLKRFPLHALKIDRSFVQDIASDPRNAAVAQAIVALGHGLDIDVIAEGVETEEQRSLLQAQGCQALQGYLFSRPLPPERFGALLRPRALAEFGLGVMPPPPHDPDVGPRLRH